MDAKTALALVRHQHRRIIAGPSPQAPVPVPPADATPRRALVVDGSEDGRLRLRGPLEQGLGLAVDVLPGAAAALEALRGHGYGLVVSELRLPGLDGLGLLEEVRRQGLPVAAIVVASHGDVRDAVRALRLGASDFLTRPVDPGRLCQAAERALRELAPRAAVAALRENIGRQFGCPEILSTDPRVHEALGMVCRAAPTDAPVLIEGETGTGKELVARAVHHNSPRRGGPLVAVNCAALPEPLASSELFGHEPGSFTGAVGRRAGRFELAHGGTIFLDEVGDLPPPVQAALVRVLHEHCFERLGGSETISVDVRVLAATNRPLRRLVRQGRFRPDLYYRLNVVQVRLPPLRRRPEDVPLLATHFAQKYAPPAGPVPRLDPEAVALLQSYPWPGNVRELENAIERACVTAHDGVIQPDDLPPGLAEDASTWPPGLVDLSRPLPQLLEEAVTDVEQTYLRKALQRSHGRLRRCARLCGLSEKCVRAKLEKYHIDRHEYLRD
jgi:DNA-binding NtrC family response regulator